MSTIHERGKKVFLTGANGFVASQILSDLIQAGYQVVGSVRSEPKAREILTLHPEWKTSVTFVYVADIAAEGAFNQVFNSEAEGFDYIIHTASPVNFKATNIQSEIIDPAVRGTIGLLNLANKHAGTKLKRFLLLGSAVAVLNSFQDESIPGKDYTEEDWNPVTAAKAIELNNVVLGYNASKTMAEKAAWEFMKKENPSFDLTVINPDIITGPMLQPVPGPNSVNETNDFAVYNFFNGQYKQIKDLTFPFYHFVDVRDVSRAHVLALTAPAASNKRIILVSGLITPQLVINIIRKNFPELRERTFEGEPSQLLPKGAAPTGWDTSRSFEVFGPGWSYISLEKSILDTVSCLLQLEKMWKV